MNVWETAILKTYEFLGGWASNHEIYENVGKFITLTAEHRRQTVYGGRPAYVHQVRSHITNLVQSLDLKKIGRSEYCITVGGRSRIKL
jgi:hypothetical protein